MWQKKQTVLKNPDLYLKKIETVSPESKAVLEIYASGI